MAEHRKKNIPIDHPERRKEMPPNGNKSVTWKYLVGVLVTLLLLLGGIILADNKALVEKNQVKIDKLTDQKVDKEQYYRDINEIKNGLVIISDKIDKIKRRNE